MAFVITADFQAEWSNLDTCTTAWNQALNICEERRANTLVFAGDGKQAYNPVDIRVIRWWQRAIERAKQNSIRVFYLLGNHDRVGQFNGADNWLPILRRAGAITFDTPGVVRDGERRLFFLPFSRSSKTKYYAKKLLKWKPDKERDILIFHCDVKNAKYNKLGVHSDASLSCKDIYSHKYCYCIGGDIHLPQMVEGNVYYVGSPYCTDWGEANQRKRYLVVDESGITSVRSTIPGWFNPSWPGFDKSKVESFRNARVKVEVKVDASEDYGRVLDKARKRAEKEYEGATVYIVPKFRDRRQEDVGISQSDTDGRKIREYVRQTCDDKRLRKSAIQYMEDKLSHFSTGLRKESRIKILSIKARNFLSFKKLDIDYRDKGITVVNGINLDTGRSIGSGKTSFFQPLPVAWFGKTFKEQKHDSWANRWTKGEAYVDVVSKDHRNRKIKVIRGRRPPKLQIKVNGKDQSSGMKSTDKDGSQLQIEQATGFTWQTLANAVYIDRDVAEAFISGTNKSRTDILSRFQNLERFEKALELVKKDRKKNSKQLHRVAHDYESVMGSLGECEENLTGLEQMAKTQLDIAYDTWQTNRKLYKRFGKTVGKVIRKLEKKTAKIEFKYNSVSNKLSNIKSKTAVVLAEWDKVESEIKDWEELAKEKECPTCHQTVSRSWVKEYGEKLASTYDVLTKKRTKLIRLRGELTEKCEMLDGHKGQIETEITEKERKGRTLKIAIQTTEKQYRQLFQDQNNADSLLSKTRKKFKEYKRLRHSLKESFKKLREKEKLYEYVLYAFSRDGIPAFLNRQLCPVLNKASDYYSELFTDKDIQVMFFVEKGEFVPQVLNAKGGETIKDQSRGEKGLAGLIASFALREVAPKCNILILDEPGEGLDAPAARQFAAALKTLKKRFDSIWIATHNQVILSELSGERVITVRKKNRISSVQR